jgi:uncharacterized membrane protein YsdA (DUF1294 family)
MLMDMMLSQSPLFWLFGLMNGVAFLLMLWDKRQSRQSGAERISEGMLFFLATAFGSIGILIGMFVFRHKTRKWYFVIGIPLLILENLALLSVLANTLSAFGGQ